MKTSPARVRLGAGRTIAWTGLSLVRVLAVALCSASASCGSEPLPSTELLGCADQPVVYGIDDREEAASVPEPWHGLAEATAIALIDPDVYASLARDPSLASRHAAGAELELCPGERFAEQPSLSDCSGILLTPDLVLTAAHCLEDASSCSEYLYVRHYVASAEGVWAGFEGAEVNRCKNTVARLEGVQPDGSFIDAALIRLAAPASPPSASRNVPVRTDAARAGEGLLLIGHPLGLPLKVSGGGDVIEPRAQQHDYFGAELDSFEGSSGGGVFDLSGALLGTVVAGQDDFVFDSAKQCYRTRVAESDASQHRYEQVTYVATALRAMCAAGATEACEVLGAAATAAAAGCNARP